MQFEIQQETINARRWRTTLSDGRTTVYVSARRHGCDWKMFVLANGRMLFQRVSENMRAKAIYDGIVGKIQREGL